MSDIYLHLQGQQTGPYQPAQIRQLLAEGKVAAETPAWYQGLTEWSTLAKVLAAFPSEGVPPAFLPPLPPAPVKKGINGCLLAAIIVGAVFGGIFVLSCLAGIALGPITNGIKKAKENAAMQQSRAIELAMFAYANDHNGAYPEGKTATEVFQELIDGNYVSDPALFYLSMTGKTKPTSNKLTADNVCYDVTSGVTADSPDDLPVVYSTGYAVNYSLGGIIMPNTSGPSSPFPGIAVAYRNNSARFWAFPSATTTIQLMPQGFDLKGHTYQQLKP